MNIDRNFALITAKGINRRSLLRLAVGIPAGVAASQAKAGMNAFFRAQQSVLNYPLGVLAAQANWDAQSVYNLQLTGNTGMRIPMSALKKLGVGNDPPGWQVPANGKGRLLPTQDGAKLIGYDLSNVYILPYNVYNTWKNIEIADCYLGPGFDQSGAGSDTVWINSNPQWIIHHNTFAPDGTDENLGHCIVYGYGCQIYRNRISGFPDDPISGSGTLETIQSQVYENYVFDPLVPAGAHVDFLNFDGGSQKVYRNLLRVSDLVKYAGFNNAFRLNGGNSGGGIYAAEIYNNITEGWESTDTPISIGQQQSSIGSYNINIHDNVISKGDLWYWFYPKGVGGVTNSSGNIDTVSGAAITEFPVASEPVLTTKGTPSAAVVGTAVTVSGEMWDRMSYGTVYYRWITIDANGYYSNAGGSNTAATYTPVSADVGKNLARITFYFAGSSAANYGTAGVSNTVTVAAS